MTRRHLTLTLTYLSEKSHEQISDSFQEVNSCYWKLIFKRDDKKVTFFLVEFNNTKKESLPSVKDW